MEESQSAKSFNFTDTTATKKVFGLKKRIRAVAGGTSASKTISILIWIIDFCQIRQNRDKLVSVVSESFPHLDKGAILDFKNIMRDRGYWKDSLWNETKHVYSFEAGNKLEFLSVDSYGKAHGPRRDVLFLNECNNLDWKIVDQLIIRTRQIVLLDWNPTVEFWFYTEMLGKRDDVDFITLTYKDNEALDEITIKEIESHKNNKNWWQVYGEGKLGEIEGKVFKDWKQIDEIPHEARLVGYGLDFGYSNHPSALIALYYYNGGYILDEKLYQKGMSNRQLADVIKGLGTAVVRADSAEPKSIDEIKSYGVPILGAVKGQGSIQQGIQFVQAQRISVTSNSLNLLNEYKNYMWATDQNGKNINEPIDAFNHAMDAVRYAFNGEKQSFDLEKANRDRIARNRQESQRFN
ncbi:MAG: terminase large subunit [Patescibacteria group bacterium]